MGPSGSDADSGYGGSESRPSSYSAARARPNGRDKWGDPEASSGYGSADDNGQAATLRRRFQRWWYVGTSLTSMPLANWT
jgi:hypothetical protein